MPNQRATEEYYKRQKKRTRKYKLDLTGQRYGRLVVLHEAEPIIGDDGKTIRRWLCKCDCGNETIVRHSGLRSGKTQSCGCLHREIVGNLHKTHGLSQGNKRLYKIWKEMRSRCSNPKNASYPKYGGKGIKVCKEWNERFVPFYEWSIANGYREDIAESGRNRLSIDRINNDGDYSPENCRWVTDDIQANNKSDSIPYDEKYVNCPVCGKPFVRTAIGHPKTCSYKCGCELRSRTHINTKDYTKICPECGKPFNAKRGGHFNDAVYCSVKCKDLSQSPIWEFNGERHHAIEWAEIVGINAHCLLHRKELGWTIEEILTTPLRGRRNVNKLQKDICSTE